MGADSTKAEGSVDGETDCWHEQKEKDPLRIHGVSPHASEI